MKVDLLCVAKNENLTIRDWVDYHLNIGFHKIWIFDNNDKEDISIIEPLKSRIIEGKVSVLPNFKGAKTFQLTAYNMFLNAFAKKNEYDWIGVIDCDEYFDFNHEKYSNVSDYFEAVEKNCTDATAVFVNWETYGDNGKYYYEEAPVIERFPEPVKKKIRFWAGDDENVHIKSFVKGEGFYISNPHNCLTRGKTYNADFQEISPQSPFNRVYSYNNVKLKHYVTKSLEEFIYRKFRGVCADNGNNRPYNLDYYWRVNEKTDDALKALEILKKKYNLNNEQ